MTEKTKNALNLIFSGTLFQFPLFSLLAKWFYRKAYGFKKVVICRNVRLVNSHKSGQANLKIGEYTSLDEDAYIDYSGGVKMGKHISIGIGVKIFTHNHEFTLEKPWAKITYSSLEIGDNAWIGTDAIILPKVKKIGEASIIGAGAIVTKDVPPFTIVAGNPAKIIRKIGEGRVKK